MYLWKKSRQYLERYGCMSAQHQGEGVGGGCAPSHAEHEAEVIYGLKTSKTSNLDSFLY